MTRTFHPSITYKISDRRRERINFVNMCVRSGYSIAAASNALDVSPTTGARYYYGYADNCLPYNTNKFYGVGRDDRSVIYEGACCAI